MQVGKSRCIARMDTDPPYRRTQIADVPLDNPLNPPWIHDLPATQNYIIVPDTPLVFTLKVHPELPSSRHSVDNPPRQPFAGKY